MNERTTSTLGALLICLPTLFLTGCSDENLGEVRGAVTLDRQPLANAFISFSPVDGGGAPSFGKTDAEGSYHLEYTREKTGAELGEHQVRIWTFSPGIEDGDAPLPPQPERAPARYNAATELKAQIVKGRNTVNFDLSSQGEIALEHRPAPVGYRR